MKIIMKKGFTLVELLVVISIIAALLGILMPALGRARQGAQSVVCLANVKRLALAGMMYADDEGVFPPFRMASLDGSVYINKYGAERPRWQWYFDQGVGPVIDPSPYSGQPSFGDTDTLLMTNDYFVCPSFKYAGWDRRDIRNGSYGYNWQYLGNAKVTAGRYHNFPVKATNIRRPGETVIIADSRGGDIPHGGHSYTLDPPKVAQEAGAMSFGPSDTPLLHSPASNRHNNKANTSFVDGHAKSMSLEQLGYVLDENGNVIADHPNGNNNLWGQAF
ncbi:MAG: prepilin-type N-terminal cleavage/methylation domain-containing protein [Sedimentisphaerales bacterium]